LLHRRKKTAPDGGDDSRPRKTASNSFEEMYRRYQHVWTLRKNVSKSSASSTTASAASSWASASSAAASDLTADWARDFHQRYNPILLRQQAEEDRHRHKSPLRKETLSEERSAVSSPTRLDRTLPPGLTSTPVNLRIRPLHQGYYNCGSSKRRSSLQLAKQHRLSQQQQQQHQSWVPVDAVLDVSGVKIYENVEFERRPVTEVRQGNAARQVRRFGHSDYYANPVVSEDKSEIFIRGEPCLDVEELVCGSPRDNSHFTGSALNTSYLEEEELMRMLSASLLDDSYEIVSVADERVVARAHFRPRSLKYPR
jgi:hypothetical protein